MGCGTNEDIRKVALNIYVSEEERIIISQMIFHRSKYVWKHQSECIPKQSVHKHTHIHTPIHVIFKLLKPKTKWKSSTRGRWYMTCRTWRIRIKVAFISETMQVRTKWLCFSMAERKMYYYGFE